MLDLSDAVGISTLFVAVGVGALALYLTRGKARLGPIQSAFAQVTLIPHRRQRFLLLLWVEVLFFLAAGVFLGLYHLGIEISNDPDLLFTVAFLGGTVTLGALTWVGLSPRPLTEEERAIAERDSPTVMESLWMVPYRRLDEENERRKTQ